MKKVDLKNVTINVNMERDEASITNINIEQAQEIWDRCSSYELMDRALKKMQMMFSTEGTVRVDQCRMRELIRQVYYPDKPCTQCLGKGEVPNTSKWCVFEEEGPMTLKCLKFNKYVQNSNICRDCHDYTAKHPKIKCPSCLNKPTLKEQIKNDCKSD